MSKIWTKLGTDNENVQRENLKDFEKIDRDVTQEENGWVQDFNKAATFFFPLVNKKNDISIFIQY